MRMAREAMAYQARVDTCRSLHLRAANARMRSTACVADSMAVMERIRRRTAARAGEDHQSKEATESVADATRAFSERAPVQRANLTELLRHLERIRAHGEAIAALYGRFHSAKRNC